MARILDGFRNLKKDIEMPTAKNLRALRQSAMAGDCVAAKALLRLYHHNNIAGEIKHGRPWSNRVRKTVNLLTAGTGEPGTIGEWEFVNERGDVNERGEIESDLLHDPPPSRKAAREPIIDD